MEISIVGNVRTPFGEVELIPQDRILLQVSSVEPLRFRHLMIHLWAMLERMHGNWEISRVVEPLLRQIDGTGRTVSIAESTAAELMGAVTLMAGEWANAHPKAFERAAAQAFKVDREGLYRELGALRESLTCSAQAIESITSEILSQDSCRLREFSQRMRRMALDVPAMQKITQAVSYRGEGSSLPRRLTRSGSRDVAAKVHHFRDVTGWHGNSDQPVIASTTVKPQIQSTNHLTLGKVLKKQRSEIGLSQQELAVKLGLKADQLAQLESDDGPRPSFQLLSRAAGILGMEKDRLFQLAESGWRSSANIRRPVSRTPGKVWSVFARDLALLDRHNVKPQELKVLSEVSLMGKITKSEALLFILDAIRESADTED
jgi:transcriptional regulator with XRE-family HTH domain